MATKARTTSTPANAKASPPATTKANTVPPADHAIAAVEVPAPATDGVGTSDHFDQELAARLRVAVNRLHRRLRQESLSGVSPAQASALATIDRRGRPTLGELAQAEMLQPPSLTPLVAAMEAAGLVVRHSDPLDRRVSRVELTAQGRKTLGRIRRLKNAYLEQRLLALDDAQHQRARELTEFLEGLVAE